jgi:hypothetical protein
MVSGGAGLTEMVSRGAGPAGMVSGGAQPTGMVSGGLGPASTGQEERRGGDIRRGGIVRSVCVWGGWCWIGARARTGLSFFKSLLVNFVD